MPFIAEPARFGNSPDSEWPWYDDHAVTLARLAQVADKEGHLDVEALVALLLEDPCPWCASFLPDECLRCYVVSRPLAREDR